jgi:hypothetical protein
MGEMIAVVCSGRMSVAAGIGPPKSISSRCVPGMGWYSSTVLEMGSR